MSVICMRSRVAAWQKVWRGEDETAQGNQAQAACKDCGLGMAATEVGDWDAEQDECEIVELQGMKYERGKHDYVTDNFL